MVEAISHMLASLPPRKPVATLLIGTTLSLIFFAVSSVILSFGWSSHLLNLRYQNEGVNTQAQLEGYKYIEEHGKGAHSGDRPLLAYFDSDGVTHIHLAREYGAAGEYGKRTLPSRKIAITYLSTTPSEARVEEWYSNPVPAEMTFGGFLALMATYLLWISCMPFFKKEQVTPSA